MATSIKETVTNLTSSSQSILEAARPENVENNNKIIAALGTSTRKKKPVNAEWLDSVGITYSSLGYDSWSLRGPNGRSFSFTPATSNSKNYPGVSGFRKNSNNLNIVTYKEVDWRGREVERNRYIKLEELVKFDIWNLLTNPKVGTKPDDYDSRYKRSLGDGKLASPRYKQFNSDGENDDVNIARGLKKDVKKELSDNASISISINAGTPTGGTTSASIYTYFYRHERSRMEYFLKNTLRAVEDVTQFMSEDTTPGAKKAISAFLKFYEQMYRKTKASAHKTQYHLDEFEFMTPEIKEGE